MQALFRSSLRVSSNQASKYFSNSLSITSTRSVVFARNERIKGAIRDPEVILTSNGVRYGLNEENIKFVKSFLQSKSNGKYQLQDSLLLQVITHKSFAHGTQPYNEKLAYLGREILELIASKHAISQETSSAAAINNKNFDSLGSYCHRMITTDRLLTDFAISKGLSNIFFCRVALPNGKESPSYKPKGIFSTITSSLVGAIAAQHGMAAAEEFVETVVFEKVLKSVLKKAVNVEEVGSHK
ncbi:hypothetical protein CANARDRAFT_30576 [[Candida] arabinofermentans NRRL YB-2248]|uniref:RNase III domain-containing protein n=1 Tax=[Candida] arabinofermentans NRRL YB-2248 TaxID=983967 RepID=A0A1E4STE3_9ASCO|nr:hypothetical protein CANARDRAFT_30576 [[Candida] arabinofermentans NRRL YB-2248]